MKKTKDKNKINYNNSVKDMVQIYLKSEDVNLTKYFASVVMIYQNLFKFENKTIKLPLFKKILEC